jgi:hypothetical protein
MFHGVNSFRLVPEFIHFSGGYMRRKCAFLPGEICEKRAEEYSVFTALYKMTFVWISTNDRSLLLCIFEYFFMESEVLVVL